MAFRRSYGRGRRSYGRRRGIRRRGGRSYRGYKVSRGGIRL